jgi:formylglycine-generating enzyme required for sulfatase activity
MAPEQLAGEPSDHRADLYSLGVVMYEVLSGTRPFEATTPTALIMKRLAGPPRPLQELRPDISTALLAAVDRCLAAEPDERFQSADEILGVLSGISIAPVSRPAAAPPPRAALTGRQRAWVMAGGAVGLVALAAAVAVLNRDDLPPPLAAVDSGMVMVPAGEYVIGFDSGPRESRPAHRVTLGAFGIDRTEVTVAEYSTYVNSIGVPAPWRSDKRPPGDTPVTGVQFSEAMKYCRWKHPDGGRLPSEEEWEAAARGPAGRRYPWGDSEPGGRADIGSTRQSPLPVGSFPNGATPEGIHGLIGGVWEWTTSTPRSYGDGSPFGTADERVIRGGAHNTDDTIATTWRRVAFRPTGTAADFDVTGFRCVMPARRVNPDGKAPS